MRGKLITFGFLMALAGVGAMVAESNHTAPPPAPYAPVSEFFELPEFIPGVGVLYVNPDTLPVGPYLSYGRDGQLIEVVFMIPLSEMTASQDWTNLGTEALQQLQITHIDHVDFTYTGGHPGMEEPHYHIRLVLVSEEEQQAALTE
jgi:hypothetical protein